MKRDISFTLLTALLACALAAPAVGQTSNPSLETSDEVVELSPFVVQGDTGWIAGTSLTGTRTNTQIKDLPISVEAITNDFMHDLNAFTLEEAGMFIANMVVTDQLEDRAFDQRRYTFRGLEQENDGGSSRNLFRWYAPTDNYNIERIDFNKGSNSLMFGDAAPGGRAATYTKRAKFNNFNEFTAVFSSYDSYRFMLDVNRKLTDKLALRLNMVTRYDGTYIDDVGSTLRAQHIAVTYEPFKNTQIRVEAERGDAHRTRGNNQVLVRQLSAPGMGLNRANSWTVTHDGTIYNRTPYFTAAHPNPTPRDTVAYGGITLSNLEGMTAVVPTRATASPTSTAAFETGRSTSLAGPPRSTALGAGGTDDDVRPYKNLSVWVLQNFGKLGVELAYNHQYNNEQRNDSASFTIAMDGDGRPYFERTYDFKEYSWKTDTLRATATYPIDLGKFGTQYVVATASSEQEETGAFVTALANFAVTDNGATGININNHKIYYRSYLDDPGFGTASYWQSFLPENLPNTSTFRPDWYNNKTTSPVQYKYQKILTLSSAGKYFDGRLHSLLGVRYDTFKLKSIPGVMPKDGIGQNVFPGYASEAPEAYAYDPLFDLENASYSSGLTYYFLPNINVYAQFSTSYNWQGARLFNNKSPGPVLGETREVGFKGSLLDDKLFFTLAGFRIDRTNAVYRWTSGPAGPALEDLFNPNNIGPGDPGYFHTPPENRGGEQRATVASEQSEGFEATIQTQRMFGFQTRFTFSKTKVTADRDFTLFKSLLDDAIARTAAALAPGGDPLMAEIEEDLVAAQNVWIANREGAPLLGNRSTPYAANWLVDYEFDKSTPLRGTRLAVYGNWRDKYSMSNLGGTIYEGGASHPISTYVIHRRKIYNHDVSFRLGVTNVIDLENSGRRRMSAVVGTLADGTLIKQYRYTTPTAWNFSTSVDF